MGKLPRPTGVTVISIIVLVLAGLGLIGLLISIPIMKDPKYRALYEAQTSMPFAAAIGIGLVVFAVQGLAAANMLMGHNWARMLYLLIVPANFVLNFATTKFNPLLIIHIIFYLVALYILTKPAANAFFGGVAPEVSQDQEIA
jgi:hypothetical protein